VVRAVRLLAILHTPSPYFMEGRRPKAGTELPGLRPGFCGATIKNGSPYKSCGLPSEIVGSTSAKDKGSKG